MLVCMVFHTLHSGKKYAEKISGPIGFMRVSPETMQGVFHRGPTMGMISIDHPDTMRFPAQNVVTLSRGNPGVMFVVAAGIVNAGRTEHI